MSNEKRIPCPYCGEMIMQGAYKCRFCGSWLIEGGRESVDKAMWADEQKEKCEELLKNGSWDDCYDHVLKVLKKAPSIQWAQEILTKLKKEKIEKLLENMNKLKGSKPAKAKEIALEILSVDGSNASAKQHLEDLALSEKREKKKLYKRDIKNALREKKYLKTIALCNQAVSENLNGEWINDALVEVGESPRAFSDFSGLTAVAYFSGFWITGKVNGDIAVLNIHEKEISESRILDFHKKKIIALVSNKNFLFAVSSDGFVSKWDKGLNLISDFKLNIKPICADLENNKLLIGSLEGSLVLVENDKPTVVFEEKNGISIVFYGEKNIHLVDLYGNLFMLYEKNNSFMSKKKKDLSCAGLSFSGSAFSTVDGSVYFEDKNFKKINLKSSVLSLLDIGQNYLAAGHFGLKVIGKKDQNLASRSTLMLAFNGSDFLCYKGDNALELWSASRWLD